MFNWMDFSNPVIAVLNILSIILFVLIFILGFYTLNTYSEYLKIKEGKLFVEKEENIEKEDFDPFFQGEFISNKEDYIHSIFNEYDKEYSENKKQKQQVEINLATHTETFPKCYKILGFSETPKDLQEIKKAYRKLSKKLHPDLGGDPIKFQEATEAYDEALIIFKENKNKI